MVQIIIISVSLMFQDYFTVGYIGMDLLSLLNSADPTMYQTEDDKATIRNMINEYTNDRRTIIL